MLLWDCPREHNYISSLNHKTSLWTILWTDFQYHWVHLVSWPKHNCLKTVTFIYGMEVVAAVCSQNLPITNHAKSIYLTPREYDCIFHAPLFALQDKFTSHGNTCCCVAMVAMVGWLLAHEFSLLILLWTACRVASKSWWWVRGKDMHMYMLQTVYMYAFQLCINCRNRRWTSYCYLQLFISSYKKGYTNSSYETKG